MNDRLARILLISSKYEEFKDLHSAKKSLKSQSRTL